MGFLTSGADLARQLMLVSDGASARAGARIETLDGLVTRSVTALLDAGGVQGTGRPPQLPSSS
jgi:uncharacterized metal-binding protein